MGEVRRGRGKEGGLWIQGFRGSLAGLVREATCEGVEIFDGGECYNTEDAGEALPWGAPTEQEVLPTFSLDVGSLGRETGGAGVAK